MNSIDSVVDENNHARPSENALDPDSVAPANETEAEAADRRMNAIANKAAAKGMQRQVNEDRDIFTK